MPCSAATPRQRPVGQVRGPTLEAEPEHVAACPGPRRSGAGYRPPAFQPSSRRPPVAGDVREQRAVVARRAISSVARPARHARALPAKVEECFSREGGRDTPPRCRARRRSGPGRRRAPWPAIKHVGDHPLGLAGEQVAGAAEAGLDLVQGQEDARLAADRRGPRRGSRGAARRSPPRPGSARARKAA